MSILHIPATIFGHSDKNENNKTTHDIHHADSYMVHHIPHDAFNETLHRFLSLDPMVEEFCKWLSYVIPFAAIVLNGLSIAVFLQRRLGKAPVSNFLIALAVSDTFAVTAVFYSAYIRLHWWPLTNFGCKFTVYVSTVGRMCSIWFTVFFTAERLLAVKYVFKRSQIATAFNIKITIMMLVGVMMIEQGYVWVWIEKVDVVEPGVCFIIDETVQRKFFILTLVLNHLCNFLVPCVIVAVMNLCIVHAMRRAVYIPGNSCRSRNMKGTRRLSVMLVIVSTTTFIFLSPETASKIMEAATEHFKPAWLANFHFVADTVSYLDHTSHFFFYVLSGREFRMDLIDMICCRRRHSVLKRQKATRRRHFCTSSHTSLARVECADVTRISYHSNEVT